MWLRNNKVGKKRLTTYSFRRRYLNYVFSHFEGKESDYLPFTLHVSKNIVNAHYKKWHKEDESGEQ
jgi:phosphomevalonate kinase